MADSDDSQLDRLRRILALAPQKKPSRLKKMLAKFGTRKPKYGRKSNKKNEAA
jgi:hypothetical protein